MLCISCSSSIPENARFCPSCGLEVSSSNTPTLSLTPPNPTPPNAPIQPTPPAPRDRAQITPPTPATPTPPPGSDFGYEARYVPGTTLADRYRIVAPLGKGGMGEVYRAEDLKLGQTVALKFLPASLARNPDALSRFAREVRLARQISHPNICRVFDLGEIPASALPLQSAATSAAHPFLTMEFVDGEDLASLLRRIGRIAPDKALDIARQLCAGLAAAHEHGIVHRDLKPANIMLDGRGRVRITDFGLSAAQQPAAPQQSANHPSATPLDDPRGGTPAYMSPEQFAGGPITTKSDLYALGLVLYEIFTGRRPFNAATFQELADTREKSSPTPPSHYVKDLDPLIERVILRCLEKDPANRPASALQVAAALPGGDPLAAAIAAGETPSPEMVAASGTQGALALAPALAIVSAILVLLAVTLLITTRAQLQNFVPGDKPPEVLKQYIRDALRDAGYDTKIADSGYWFGASDAYFDYARQIPAPERYREIFNYFPSPVSLTLRQSPQELAAPPTYPLGDNFPALTVPGESIATVDTEGHLTSFHIVPLDAPPPTAQSNSTELPTNFDWTPIFSDAGLDLHHAKPVPATWYPSIASDLQFAWDVPHAGKNIRVEAATFRGRPVYFKVVPVWDLEKPGGTSTEGTLPQSAERVEAINLGIMVLSVAVCIFLTRRNLRLKRGDLRGAWRAGLCVFVLMAYSQLVASHWIMNSFWQWDLFFTSLGIGAAYGIVFMLLYLSAEPFLRSTWPEVLVSWTRLVGGQYRDPMIGRDVLMGTLIGLGIAAASELMSALPNWFPIQRVTPAFDFDCLGGNLMFLGQIARQWTSPFINTMGILVFVLIAWKIVRLKWIALTLTFITYTVIMLNPENPLGLLPLSIVIAALGMLAVIRYGAVAIFVALGMREVFSLSAITLDLHRWYAYQTPILILIVLAITAYGFLLSIRPRLHTR